MLKEKKTLGLLKRLENREKCERTNKRDREKYPKNKKKSEKANLRYQPRAAVQRHNFFSEKNSKVVKPSQTFNQNEKF